MCIAKAKCQCAEVLDAVLQFSEFWKWPVYREWARLAEFQKKDETYVAGAMRQFEQAALIGGARAVLAVIRHLIKDMRDDERDAA
jgi:hypothetical protein